MLLSYFAKNASNFSDLWKWPLHMGAFCQFPFRWIYYCLVVIPPESKLAKRSSVHCDDNSFFFQTKLTAQTTNANNVSNPEEMILTALNTSRSMQTRTLKIAQDDPKITKVVKVAQILREIFSATIATSPKGAKLFKEMPSRKRNPDYFEVIEEPMDLNTIEKTINSGLYSNPDQFDRDFLMLFQNNYRLVKYFFIFICRIHWIN